MCVTWQVWALAAGPAEQSRAVQWWPWQTGRTSRTPKERSGKNLCGKTGELDSYNIKLSCDCDFECHMGNFQHISKNVFLTLSVLGEDAGCNTADVFFTDAVVAYLHTHNTDVNCQYHERTLKKEQIPSRLDFLNPHMHTNFTCGRRAGMLKRCMSPRLVRQTSVCSL